jgi:hypothetical protein
MTPDKKVKILATLGPAIDGIDDIPAGRGRGQHLPQTSATAITPTTPSAISGSAKSSAS